MSSSHLNFNFCKDLEDLPHCLHGNAACRNPSIAKADPSGKGLKWMGKIRGKEPCQAECQQHQTQEFQCFDLPIQRAPEPGKMDTVLLLTGVSCPIFQRILETFHYLHSQDCSYFRNQ